MYSYSVDLVGLQSTDYSGREVRSVDGAQFARYYDPPSTMFPHQSSSDKSKKNQKRNHCLELYALEERKVLSLAEAEDFQLKPLSTECNEGRQHRFRFTKQEQQKFIQKHFNNGSCPDFIANLSTLKMLMTQPNDFKVIANKIRLDNGETSIYLKYHHFIQETSYRNVGYLVEDILAINMVQQNQILEAIYRATLTKSDENEPESFHIGFIAETDGIWNQTKENSSQPECYEAKDVAEVKSVGTAKFYYPRKKQFSRSRNKSHKYSHYHYEENVLRRYWAQCRLRGIEKLLCAVVEGSNQHEVMKEIWMYDVNRIPSLLKKGNKNARPFPKVGFNNLNIVDQEKFAQLHQTLNWKEWSEETEFEKLFAALYQISQSFPENDSKNPTRYFAFKKQDNSFDEITSQEFDKF